MSINFSAMHKMNALYRILQFGIRRFLILTTVKTVLSYTTVMLQRWLTFRRNFLPPCPWFVRNVSNHITQYTVSQPDDHNLNSTLLEPSNHAWWITNDIKTLCQMNKPCSAEWEGHGYERQIWTSVIKPTLKYHSSTSLEGPNNTIETLSEQPIFGSKFKPRTPGRRLLDSEKLAMVFDI
jgi:hypothetical protein